MSKLYIIDGNNLLHTIRKHENLPGKWDFEKARRKLSCRMREFAGESEVNVILIYDGTIGGLAPEYQTPDFQVIFTDALSSADHLIEQLVAGHSKSEQITVVTSDRTEQNVVKAAGAFVISCHNFIDQLDYCRKETIKGINHSITKTPKVTLGDIFPE